MKSQAPVLKSAILSIDYSSLGMLPEYFGIHLSLNVKHAFDWMWNENDPGGLPYTHQRFLIDNIALTSGPEPAVSAFGVVGTLLAPRGRRR